MTILSWPRVAAVLAACFGMAPLASSGIAPKSANPEGEAKGLESPVHPAPHGSPSCPRPSTAADLKSCAVPQKTSGAPVGAEPLRRGEFRDNATCQRGWMGGTCFLQEHEVCTLVLFKVDGEWRMDCY